jgi:Ca2+-binding RTX toxin-like protein
MTIQTSILELRSVITQTGYDVQVWLKAGTVVDAIDLALTYDATKASYISAVKNPALVGWTWANGPTSGNLLIGGYSLTAIDNISDVLLQTISFSPLSGSNGFTAALVGGTELSYSGSPIPLSALPTLTILGASNNAPVAVNDSLTVMEDTAVIYTAAQLLGNDSDADGNPLTIASVLAGSNGTVILNLDGTVTFTPTANFNGVADFSYVATDGIAHSNSATVTVNVAAVNVAPTGPVIIMGSAIQNQTLSATNSLADSNGLGVIAYQWLANGTVIAGATGITLLLGDALVGKTITAQASYTDQQGTYEQVLSTPTNVVVKITNFGTLGADNMKGTQGNDVYVVNNPNDIITESKNAGIDTVVTTINYTLANNLENLTLSGTKALNGTGNNLNNTLIGNTANNVLNGGIGADKLMGGLGNDTYYVDNKGDKVTEEANAGTDTVISSITYLLGANLENLTLSGISVINGTGNELNNSLLGNVGANALSGLEGDDIIFGGLGKDKLTGGAGKDTFDFNASLEIGKGTARDAILDFTHSEGDKIDLSGIDTNSSKAGNQAFTYLDSKAFDGKAGEIHFIKGVLSGDTNGDKVADFEMSIMLVGGTTLVSQDFVL